MCNYIRGFCSCSYGPPEALLGGLSFAVGGIHWSSPTGPRAVIGWEWRDHPRARPVEHDIPPHRPATAYWYPSQTPTRRHVQIYKMSISKISKSEHVYLFVCTCADKLQFVRWERGVSKKTLLMNDHPKTTQWKHALCVFKLLTTCVLFYSVINS